MNIKEQVVKILVVNFGGTPDDPWNLFCGIDKHRVVFFQYLNVWVLPAYSAEGSTTIGLHRNGTLYANGTPYLSSGHIQEFRFAGFEDIKLDEKDRLVAFNLLPGDILEIDKKDWDADDNPLSLISTRRSVGNDFHLVFHGDEIAQKIMNAFHMTYHDLSTKRVIFENKPGGSKRYISHF